MRFHVQVSMQDASWCKYSIGVHDWLAFTDYPHVRLVAIIYVSCLNRRTFWPRRPCPSLPLWVEAGSEAHIYIYWQVLGPRWNAIPLALVSLPDGAHTMILKLDWGRPDRRRVAFRQSYARTFVGCRCIFEYWCEQVLRLVLFPVSVVELLLTLVRNPSETLQVWTWRSSVDHRR